MSKEHIVKMIAGYNGSIWFGDRGRDIAEPRLIEGELGVLFEGVDFIPYGDLGFNEELGFYRISAFPEYKNEALRYAEEGEIINLGDNVVMTRGIEAELERAGLDIRYLKGLTDRYARGDWGSMGHWRGIEVTDRELLLGALETAEDDKLNLINTLSGINRISASYDTEELGRVWIITEADRSVTTILKPEEY